MSKWIFDGHVKIRKDKIVLYRPGWQEWQKDCTCVVFEGSPLDNELTIQIPYERFEALINEDQPE